MKSNFEIVHTKRGMKTLIKKIIWMQAYYVTSGIQKQEGRTWVHSSTGKQKIKLASLADLLEQTMSWIQSKNTVIENTIGDKKIIRAGARMRREGRIFIMLNKIPEAWSNIKAYYRILILKHLNSKNRRYKQGAGEVLQKLGIFVRDRQKERILLSRTSSNKPLTMWQKGFDHPLMDSGKMEHSIRSKRISSANGKAQRDEAKMKYTLQIDKYIKQLNRK